MRNSIFIGEVRSLGFSVVFVVWTGVVWISFCIVIVTSISFSGKGGKGIGFLGF